MDGGFSSILVGIREPSGRRQLALDRAAVLARASGARLTLFHAFAAPLPLPHPLPSDPVRLLKAVARDRLAELQALAGPLRRAGLKVECLASWDFPPAHAIVRQARRQRPDLVVAESHRHSRLARWLLANNDWDLIRECPCPVWFVKRWRWPARPLVLAAVDPAHAQARPSGLDTRILQAAANAAGPLGGRLGLVHAGTPGAPAGTRATLQRLARRHAIPPALQWVADGDPASLLPASTAELKAAVLVMGAVSRRSGTQAFIGNTAEAVIDAVDCDLLIIKPRGFRSALPRERPRIATVGH